MYHIGGQRYLKLFGPTAERQFQVERAVLQTLENQNAIPAPRVVAVGERSQIPPYLILSAIAGSTAEEVWEALGRAEQLAIARELGVITAAIQRLLQQALAIVEQQFGGRRKHVKEGEARRSAQIEATESVAAQRRDN